MCDKRIMALKQQLIKPARPVQTVTPEPVKPLQSLPQTVKPSRVLKKANTMPKVILYNEWYLKKFQAYMMSLYSNVNVNE